MMAQPAAPATWSRFYVPEIHDIHPGMASRFDALLGLLPTAARDVTALLVVPDWHGQGVLSPDGALCRRLRDLPGEKVLHGWTHSLGPDFMNWAVYGHENRSEFGRLGQAEAARRLERGLATYRACFGHDPRWFCAPRWAESAGTAAALRDIGIGARMLRTRLQAGDDTSVPLPALCFDVGDRALPVAVMRRAREPGIRRLLAEGRPFRLTLHPSDPDHPATWAQMQRLVRHLEAQGWTPLSPDQAVARWRALGG